MDRWGSVIVITSRHTLKPKHDEVVVISTASLTLVKIVMTYTVGNSLLLIFKMIQLVLLHTNKQGLTLIEVVSAC